MERFLPDRIKHGLDILIVWFMLVFSLTNVNVTKYMHYSV